MLRYAAHALLTIAVSFVTLSAHALDYPRRAFQEQMFSFSEETSRIVGDATAIRSMALTSDETSPFEAGRAEEPILVTRQSMEALANLLHPRSLVLTRQLSTLLALPDGESLVHADVAELGADFLGRSGLVVVLRRINGAMIVDPYTAYIADPAGRLELLGRSFIVAPDALLVATGRFSQPAGVAFALPGSGLIDHRVAFGCDLPRNTFVNPPQIVVATPGSVEVYEVDPCSPSGGYYRRDILPLPTSRPPIRLTVAAGTISTVSREVATTMRFDANTQSTVTAQFRPGYKIDDAALMNVDDDAELETLLTIADNHTVVLALDVDWDDSSSDVREMVPLAWTELPGEYGESFHVADDRTRLEAPRGADPSRMLVSDILGAGRPELTIAGLRWEGTELRLHVLVASLEPSPDGVAVRGLAEASVAPATQMTGRVLDVHAMRLDGNDGMDLAILVGEWRIGNPPPNELLFLRNRPPRRRPSSLSPRTVTSATS